MKIVKNVIDLVAGLMSVICITFAILMLVGYKPVVIQSGSMSPAIMTGDLCLVHSDDEYLLNDIVTFSVEDIYVTHRIVCDNDDGTYMTQGDANKIEDSALLKKEQIVGKVNLVLPKVGFIYAVVTTFKGKVLLCVVMFALIGTSMILEDKIKSNNGSNEREVNYEE